MIARSISKCEFKTIMNGTETQGDEYYLWNVEPNRNQNSSAFLQKLICTLYRDNECLVIETDDRQLLVADSFIHDEYALYDDIFSNVTVGDYVFKKSFRQSDVLYFKLCNKNINRLLKLVYESYGKLLAYGEKYYLRSRGTKGTLEIPGMFSGDEDAKSRVDAYLSNQTKAFLESDNGVLPIYQGYKYTDLGSKTYANDSTRDIRAMIDDVYDFTARGFGIPPAMLRGDIANVNDAVDNYLTFCIDPLVDLLSEEINRKRNGKSGFLRGNRIVIDTRCIKHVDLLGVSTAIDKLISSGVFCINDIRQLVGDEPIDEHWAWEHWITKNYTKLEEQSTNAGGGDNEQ